MEKVLKHLLKRAGGIPVFIFVGFIGFSFGQFTVSSLPKETFSSALLGNGFGLILTSLDVNGDNCPELIATSSDNNKNYRWCAMTCDRTLQTYVVNHSSYLYNTALVSNTSVPGNILQPSKLYFGFSDGKIFGFNGYENVPSDTFMAPRYLKLWVSNKDTLWDSATYVPQTLTIDTLGNKGAVLAITSDADVFLYDLKTHAMKYAFHFPANILGKGRVAADSSFKAYLANGEVYQFTGDTFMKVGQLPISVRATGYGIVSRFDIADCTGNGVKNVICLSGDNTGSRLIVIDSKNGQVLCSDSLPGADMFWTNDINRDGKSEILIRIHKTSYDSLVCVDGMGSILWKHGFAQHIVNLHCNDFNGDGSEEMAMAFQGNSYESDSFVVCSLENFSRTYSCLTSTGKLILDIGDPERNGTVNLVGCNNAGAGEFFIWDMKKGCLEQKRMGCASITAIAVGHKYGDPDGVFLGNQNLMRFNGVKLSVCDTLERCGLNAYDAPNIVTIYPFSLPGSAQPMVLFGYMSDIAGGYGMIYDFQSIFDISLRKKIWSSNYDGNYWDRSRKKAMIANFDGDSIPDVVAANHTLTRWVDTLRQGSFLLDSCWVFDVAQRPQGGTDIIVAGTETGSLVYIDSSWIDRWKVSKREIGDVAVFRPAGFGSVAVAFSTNGRLYLGIMPEKKIVWTSPLLTEDLGTKVGIDLFQQGDTVFFAASAAGSFYCYAFSGSGVLGTVGKRNIYESVNPKKRLQRLFIEGRRGNPVVGDYLVDCLGRKIPLVNGACGSGTFRTRPIANGIYFLPDPTQLKNRK